LSLVFKVGIQVPLIIEVKYSSPRPQGLFQAHPGEWIDLSTEDEVNLKAGEVKLISLGVVIKLPEGYEAIVAPRSSTFKNYGILQANSIGIIDNSYCGPDDIWKFLAYATRDVTIPANSRIAQFRIQEIQPEIEIKEITNISNQNRGGIGSTGT